MSVVPKVIEHTRWRWRNYAENISADLPSVTEVVNALDNLIMSMGGTASYKFVDGTEIRVSGKLYCPPDDWRAPAAVAAKKQPRKRKTAAKRVN